MLYALKIIGGMIGFLVAFIFLGSLVGNLSEKHRTGMAFLALFTGLAVVLLLAVSYGHAVR